MSLDHRAGTRERRNFLGMQIAGKTLAVMGFGEVGFEVARRAKGLGMQVIAYDPYASTYRARSIGIELVGFDKALMSADVVSLHMHLTPTTRKMLRDETFEKMKKGVHILNVAHRELVDEEALLRALDAGIVSRVIKAELSFFSNVLSPENRSDPSKVRNRPVQQLLTRN